VSKAKRAPKRPSRQAELPKGDFDFEAAFAEQDAWLAAHFPGQRVFYDGGLPLIEWVS
jgi:hypothetical protein